MTAAVAPRLQAVLIAHDVHDHGGMERVCAQLLRHARDEVEFTVVSSQLQEDLRPFVRWVRVPVPRRPFPLKFVAFQLLAPLALLRAGSGIRHAVGAIVPNRIDVSAIHFCQAGFAEVDRPSSASRSVARRVNYRVHRSLALAAERWSFRPGRVRLLAAVSHGVRRELERHYPGVEVGVTPNGVDLERFKPSPEARTEVRSELGVDDDAFVGVFVGGDWERKGLSIAIEALGKVRAAGVAGAQLWVVGEGRREVHEQIARAAGVEDVVRFLGRRTDAERFYAAADVHVFPTLYEAFPLVAMEAAASGLAIVMTPVNGSDELGGADGVLLVERTAEAFGEALVRLAGDRALRERMGVAARARVESFSWAASARSVVDAYRRLA